MNVVAICGSPRKGNVEAILNRILDGVEFTGHKGEIVLLREMDIKFCDGCERCVKEGRCMIDDGMQHVYSKLEHAEYIILGTPSYWDNVSGLMKVFMDRTNPYYLTKKLSGKRAILVAVGGKSASRAMESLNVFCTHHGMDIKRSISMKVDGPEEVLKDTRFMDRCFETGKDIGSRKI